MTSRELMNRRNFLHRATGLAGGVALSRTLLDLRLMGNAVAAVDVGDYKALVCFFMAGGNDNNNLLVPAPGDDRYAGYKAVRGSRLALWEDQAAAAGRADAGTNPNNYWALPLNGAGPEGGRYAVHSSMPAVQGLYNQGRLAFVANAGVLVEPVTKAQYLARLRKLPPQLFSHNDQVTQWQTSVPDNISRTGWGGRTADRVREELARQGLPPGSISMSVSLAGSNTWEVGDTVNQFQVSTAGAVSFQQYTGARKVLMDAVLRAPGSGGSAALAAERTNLHLRDFQKVNERAIFNGAALSTALGRLAAGGADVAMGAVIDGAFGLGGGVTYGSLSGVEQQLHTVARIIAQRGYLGMRRQIFFCQVGGYDTHGDQPVAHAGLLATLSRAIGRFSTAMTGLGVADKVTGFTASDFGRTFKSNGLGTDHAWGSHQMVFGGAVKGGKVYGSYPTLALNGPDDYDTGSGATGRWIPTMSADEYAATLARWFGLGEGELDAVFPNLGRFARRDVGFLI
jgi:uncharacterized protein (DUF1501 family)